MNDREAEAALRVRRLGTPDERRDAEGRLREHYRDDTAVRDYQQALPQGMGEGMAALQQIQKAVSYGARRNFNVRNGPVVEGGRSSFSMNPRDHGSEVPGTRTKKYKVNPLMLREAAHADPTITSILQNFKNRSVSYAEPVDASLAVIMGEAKGFDLVRTDKPPYEPLTPDELADKRRILEFIAHSGDVPRFTADGTVNSDDLERANFAQFVSMLVRDRFELDAISIELQRSNNARALKGYYAVDGGTIYRTLYPDWPYGDVNSDIPEGAAYCQTLDGQVVGTWDSNRMLYHVANPRSDLRLNGYGISEVEMSLRLTTGIINVITMNNSIFDRNSLPEGILYIKGQINDEAFQIWKDEWDAFRQGPGGAYGLPSLSIRDPQGGIEWVPIGKGPSDMEFSRYMSFLIALRCAIFGVDVGELNASSFGGQNGGLNSGKDTVARMQESRDRGFMPWMADLARIMNKILEPLLAGRWRFTWRGLEKHVYDERLWEAYMKVGTVDEVRMAVFQHGPLGGMVGNSLADNAAISQMVAVAAKDGTPVGGKMGEALEGAIDDSQALVQFNLDQKIKVVEAEAKAKAKYAPKLDPGGFAAKKPAKKASVAKALIEAGLDAVEVAKAIAFLDDD